MLQYSSPSVAVNLVNTLGEGPTWNAASGRLFWVDIKQRLLFEFDSRTSRVRQWRFAERLSLGAPASGGGLIVVCEGGLFRFFPESGRRTGLVTLPDGFEGLRSNDAKVDADGALWWSTMDDNAGRRPGAVYRTCGGVTTRVLEGIHIANSLAFTADGQSMYLSDSSVKTLWRFQRLGGGQLAQREVFAVFSDGEPDGAAIDAEGALWVAVWGGHRVDRFLPDGTLERSISLPVSQPTACAFGGSDLATLYITSARDGLSPQALAREPLAGALFAVVPGVCGQPIPPFASGTFDRLCGFDPGMGMA